MNDQTFWNFFVQKKKLNLTEYCLVLNECGMLDLLQICFLLRCVYRFSFQIIYFVFNNVYTSNILSQISFGKTKEKRAKEKQFFLLFYLTFLYAKLQSDKKNFSKFTLCSLLTASYY